MMTATTYVSFIGAGNYQPAVYRWLDRDSTETPYAQEAELELMLASGIIADPGDVQVLIFGTPTSMDLHWEHQIQLGGKDRTERIERGPGLRPRLEALGFDPKPVEIGEDLSTDTQWQTFQQLLQRIAPRTRLIWDMTHGFRAVPVVFSSALRFLRLTRQVELIHVLYGAHDKEPPQIIDYVHFFAIHDWTDAVSRLVDDADARKLAELAEHGSSIQVTGFEGQALTDALMTVSDAVRSVDVHGLEPKVRSALALVQAGMNQAEAGRHVAGQTLLKMVRDKFAGLMTAAPLSGRYDEAYFDLQLTFIDLLLQHRLFMQAFTAMREYVGSLGMRSYKAGALKFTNATGRRKRSYAEIFVSMVTYPEPDWTFAGHAEIQKNTLYPYFKALERMGAMQRLHELINEVADIRNGFDHAWTSKSEVPETIAADGARCLRELREITELVLMVQPDSLEPADQEGAQSRQLLVLMNHDPTIQQRDDARQRWGLDSDDWRIAPAELRQIWAGIDPAASRMPVALRQGIESWLDNAGSRGDLLLVQGDPGATQLAVELAGQRGLKPIYSTTRRNAVETQGADGRIEKRSVFEHVRFRDY